MVKRLLLPALAASCLADTARANPLDTFGFGSREVALGGAVAADDESASSVYYNPAGLSRGDELRVSLGYMRNVSSLEIHGERSNVDPVAGINLGIVAPIPIGSQRLAFGLGVHLPDNRISRTRSVLFERPRWEFYDTRPHKIFLSTALSYQPIERLRFGAGITFQSPSKLELNLRGQADFFTPEASTLEHEFGGNLLSIRYIHAGVQVDATDWLAFGLSYRGELTVGMELKAEADASLEGIGDSIPLYFLLINQGTNTYFPQELVLSTAARPIDALRLSFDLEWRDWSRHPSLISSDTVVLDLELPPAFANLNLPDEIRGRSPIPMRARDRFIPRFGVEYQALDTNDFGLALRGGYAFERSPFPAQRGTTNFVDNDRHAISMGVGLELRDLDPIIDGALRFDANFVYYHLPERVHDKLSPIDPVGDYTSGGHQIGMGLQMEVLFE